MSYNRMFERLVRGKDDMEGQIAYCLYKKQKAEFFSDIEKEHKRKPTQEEIKSLESACSTESSIENYKVNAKAILSEFVESAVSEEVSEIEIGTREETIEELNSIVNGFQANNTQETIGQIQGLITNIQQQTTASDIQNLKDVISPIVPITGWRKLWEVIWQNFVASIVVIFVIYFLSLALNNRKEDPEKLISKMLNNKDSIWIAKLDSIMTNINTNFVKKQ